MESVTRGKQGAWPTGGVAPTLGLRGRGFSVCEEA